MLLRKKSILLIFCLSLATASLSASHTFQPDAYLKHVKFLASDALAGRGNGTPELNQAADYIAAAFRSSGLQPGGDNGTYFQKFTISTGGRLGTGNRLSVKAGGESVEAALRKDFLPTGMGEKTSIGGDVVFAGYGITATEYKYDDYKDFDVTDKIVLVLAHEPGENDSASPFNGREPTLHGHDNSKAANAKARGARALLIVQDPANHDDPDGDLPVTTGEEIDDVGICVIRITRGLAQRMLDPDDKSLLELQKQIDATMSPRSSALKGVELNLVLDVTRTPKEVRNVLALLPGTDPAVSSETVIIGAHYDHLGRGGRSSMVPKLIGEIHHGADDNASGTAGLIEVAAALARDPAPHGRAYLFIAFAGEEVGLRGSYYWTGHPTRPLDKSIAMLNMDMIGRMRENRILIGGVGTSPAFPELVQIAAQAAGLQVRTNQSGYGASDHMAFYIKNMPVLFFFSDLHSDYHRPEDTWDKINADGAAKILGMVFDIATRLDAVEQPPRFTKVDEPQPPTGGRQGYGAYFGSIPDMSDEVKGVRFSDVQPNSPAAKAGLKGQDVLVRFDGKEIANLQDFTYMLRTHKPGDAVEVIVMRDGAPMTVKVTLEVRR
jgi:hypothetical protein